jgi:hypothetical protein
MQCHEQINNPVPSKAKVIPKLSTATKYTK